MSEREKKPRHCTACVLATTMMFAPATEMVARRLSAFDGCDVGPAT